MDSNSGQLHYPVLVQGIIGAGGIFVGTNPSYTSYELHHTLETSKARFIITEPELLQTIRKPALHLDIPNENMFITATEHPALRLFTDSPHKSWRYLLKHGEAEWARFDDMNTALDLEEGLALLNRQGGVGKPMIGRDGGG